MALRVKSRKGRFWRSSNRSNIDEAKYKRCLGPREISLNLTSRNLYNLLKLQEFNEAITFFPAHGIMGRKTEKIKFLKVFNSSKPIIPYSEF